MLARVDGQRGFFDAAWCAGLLAENSIYALLAEHGERIVRDEDFAECYSPSHGRPSIPPSLLAKVLLLAFRNGLSDERAMEALRFDLRWKAALDLPIDHPGFHPTSLVRFRARLLLHGKERIVFERSVELATELGLIEGRTEQIVDSTPMLGAAAVQDTVTLVRAGVRKLLDAARAADGPAAHELAAGLAFDYAQPREKPAGDWHDKVAREALLVEVATAHNARCAPSSTRTSSRPMRPSVSRPESRGDRITWSLQTQFLRILMTSPVLRCVPGFELRRREIAERFVQPRGVEPGDVFDDRQLEL
jgi:transposase